MNKMLYNVLASNRRIEVAIRCFAARSGSIKSFLKKRMRQTDSKKITFEHPSVERSKAAQIGFLESLRKCAISDDDIVIVHSSMDGLELLGLSPKEIIDVLRDEFGSGVTLVFATYAAENKRINSKCRKYNPARSVCWTGMLPNVFLQCPGVTRSRFPYNSLAAQGPHAEKMFEHDLESRFPHDKNSAWYYCYAHHAKILMLGTTSIQANTMLYHMVSDVMEDGWPIENWYDSSDYEIVLPDETIYKTIEYQGGFWARYCTEYSADRRYKKKGLIRDVSSDDIVMEIVDDSFMMLNAALEDARNGLLTYQVPKKYWKTPFKTLQYEMLS